MSVRSAPAVRYGRGGPRLCLPPSGTAIIACAALAAGCSKPVEPGQPRTHGIRVEAEAQAGGGVVNVSGELLAVSGDSIWVLVDGDAPAVRALARSGSAVRPLDGAPVRPGRWAVMMGGATGLGLLISCMAYDASGGCLLIAPVALAAHAAVAGVAALLMAVDPPDPMTTDPAELSRFARFPAGLPPGFPRAP